MPPPRATKTVIYHDVLCAVARYCPVAALPGFELVCKAWQRAVKDACADLCIPFVVVPAAGAETWEANADDSPVDSPALPAVP